jgi:hypothetical protein
MNSSTSDQNVCRSSRRPGRERVIRGVSSSQAALASVSPLGRVPSPDQPGAPVPSRRLQTLGHPGKSLVDHRCVQNTMNCARATNASTAFGSIRVAGRGTRKAAADDIQVSARTLAPGKAITPHVQAGIARSDIRRGRSFVVAVGARADRASAPRRRAACQARDHRRTGRADAGREAPRGLQRPPRGARPQLAHARSAAT